MKHQYQLLNYDGLLIIAGPGLNAQAVEEIKNQLDPETRGRVIGWKTTGR